MTVWWRETWQSTAVDLTVENQPTNNQHPALSSITSTGGPPVSENWSTRKNNEEFCIGKWTKRQTLHILFGPDDADEVVPALLLLR